MSDTLFVDSSEGNVGIGTTNPGAKLEVADGDVNFSNGIDPGFYFDKTNNRVGIGTVPVDDFHIDAGAVTRMILEGARTGTGNPFVQIQFYNTDTALYTGAQIASWNMGGNNAGDLRFYTNSDGGSDPTANLAERMRITKDGNVGIGTTNPGAHKLYINGTYIATVNSMQELYPIWDIGNTTYQYLRVMGNSRVETGCYDGELGVCDFTINPVGGNVGIGTGSPAGKLEVAGGRVEFTDTTDATPTAGTGVLEIANALRLDGNEIITNTGTTLYLQNDNNGNLSVDAGTLFVDASGKVGIGTSSPENSLHIAKDDVAVSIMIHEVAGDTSWYRPDIEFRRARGTLEAKTAPIDNDYLGIIRFVAYNGSLYKSSADIISQVDGTPGAGVPSELSFQTTEDGTYTKAQRMIIRNDGNVGIGTGSPGSILHIKDNTPISLEYTATDPVRIHYYGQGYAGIGPVGDVHSIILTNSTHSYGTGIYYDPSNKHGGLFLYTEDGAYNPVLSMKTGNVGIGNTGPDTKLHVTGGVCIDTDAACTDPGAGNAYLEGDLTVSGGDMTLSGTSTITSGGSQETYGSLTIDGSKSSYSGIHFADVTGDGDVLMVHNTNDIQGFWASGTGWSWYFSNGALTAGTVPAARITSGTFGSGDYTFPGDLTVSGNDIKSGGESLTFMKHRADDTNYEWVGFYSGTTVRQGIILYDGAWNGCRNVADEFCLKAENSNDLSLYAADDVFIRAQGGDVTIRLG